VKIAYCGYDFFHACLNELLACEHDVYRVFTFPCDNRFNFNQYVRAICRKHNLPLSEERIDAGTVKELEAAGCELIITAGYKYKIPDLTACAIKGINIHPALLPVGRGIWPLPWTILTGQTQSGITIHKLSETYDAGDILAQQHFSLHSNERLESLSAKLQLMAPDIVRNVIQDFVRYWDNALPQTGNVIEWGMPARHQRTLNWQNGVEELDRVCRAFGKFGCYGYFDRRNWVVYGLTAWKEQHNFAAGAVVHKTNTEKIVAASDGFVTLLYFEAAPE
jgi:methionyl-tRNA formyltransferase